MYLFGDKVRVKAGFYKGQVGILVDVVEHMSSEYNKYIISFHVKEALWSSVKEDVKEAVVYQYDLEKIND